MDSSRIQNGDLVQIVADTVPPLQKGQFADVIDALEEGGGILLKIHGWVQDPWLRIPTHVLQKLEPDSAARVRYAFADLEDNPQRHQALSDAIERVMEAFGPLYEALLAAYGEPFTFSERYWMCRTVGDLLAIHGLHPHNFQGPDEEVAIALEKAWREFTEASQAAALLLQGDATV